jgi:hypothetical protein
MQLKYDSYFVIAFCGTRMNEFTAGRLVYWQPVNKFALLERLDDSVLAERKEQLTTSFYMKGQE